MAIDLALLARAQGEQEGVWRCYAWERPSISFGRNESVRGRFDAASVAAAGLDVVRRPTGGRALLHAREVTYSVTMPLPTNVPWRHAYDAVNRILLDALRQLGVPATLVADDSTAATRPDGPLCFALPSAGEIMLHGAKLVGSSVWREGGAYLQHGSILLHDDQPRLLSAMCQPARASADALPPAASLSEWSARAARDTPTWGTVVLALEQALERTLERTLIAKVPSHGSLALFDPTAPSFLARVSHAERDVESPEWLWRR